MSSKRHSLVLSFCNASVPIHADAHNGAASTSDPVREAYQFWLPTHRGEVTEVQQARIKRAVKGAKN